MSSYLQRLHDEARAFSDEVFATPSRDVSPPLGYATPGTSMHWPYCIDALCPGCLPAFDPPAPAPLPDWLRGAP